MFVFFFF
ncbi:hypothetical protein VN97_g13007, partial [Penicillium thymicola]